MFALLELIRATGGRLISGRRDLKVKGISIDSRTIKPQEAFIAIKGNNFDGHDFIDAAIKKGANCIIASKVKSDALGEIAFIKVKDTTRALGDIARFQRRKFNIPIIAVTGSNGKTTAKEMIAWVLAKRFKVLKNEGTKNNHIGLPMTLLKINKSYDIVVLEAGTNHFGEIDYLTKICQPNIGLITNIGPSHLEYLGGLEGVWREKSAVLKNLKKPYIAVLNADDNLLRKEILKKDKKPFTISFAIQKGADFCAPNIKTKPYALEFCLEKYKFTLRTLGYYNIYNALAAIAVVRLFGLEYSDIASRLRSFEFPQGRLKLRQLKGVTFIDDTYNSNPFSLKQALDTLANFSNRGRKIFVMGDMLELGRQSRILHCQAGKDVSNICHVFIAIGELAKLAAGAARRCGFEGKNIFTCESTSQAREILFNKIALKKDDIVLVKGSRAIRMEDILKV